MTVMLVELAVIIPSVSLGAGRHVEYLDPKANIQGLHLNLVTQPLCLIALWLTKLSVGLFLIRLTPSKRHVRIIWGVMILTVLSWLGNFRISALTDLIFALLPIPLVRRLQMNRRTKVAIIEILSLGIFVTACAIIKMNYLGSYGEHGDFLFDSSEITIW
ncbi:hypothetical protein KC332_g8281 [Hortaea werneckii]|nr:hypothetical protein KC358_g8127 [Hortaea werneckii]KAI6830439.1 hypothetical protein KC350_g7573 [Hortaea werneckii]KAI6926856.1 hypothetical protein KC348_g8541 [Hortaea werneckii]KAI6933879.1 hypothetical protein KC341_g7990 [Hortaea werneckii]KAI6968526.1 hypothetical protein KC321_g8396 [Hortaea werneckii]